MTEEAFVQEMEKALEPASTALTVLQPEPGASLTRRFRHNAPLVSQLIAVKLDVPQARARRRAGPKEGVAAYGATGETLVKSRRRTGASWPA